MTKAVPLRFLLLKTQGYESRSLARFLPDRQAHTQRAKERVERNARRERKMQRSWRAYSVFTIVEDAVIPGRYQTNSVHRLITIANSMIIIHPFHPLSPLHFSALLLLGQHSWLLVVVFPFKVAKEDERDG